MLPQMLEKGDICSLQACVAAATSVGGVRRTGCMSSEEVDLFSRLLSLRLKLFGELAVLSLDERT